MPTRAAAAGQGPGPACGRAGRRWWWPGTLTRPRTPPSWSPWSGTAQQAVASLDDARATGARPVHDGLAGNCLVDLTMFDDARLAGIFAAAPAVVGGRLRSARVAALPLEGRACLAEWDERDGQLVLHVSTQVPHQVRSGGGRGLLARRTRDQGDRPGRRRWVRAEVRGGQ